MQNYNLDPENLNLTNLSIDELKSMRKVINSELNFRSHQQLVENKNSIQVGDHITVDNKIYWRSYHSRK